MSKVFYKEVKSWMYRNARPIDLSLWKYFFEEGSKEEVLDALSYYQNEDGGFGHALEADSWNPHSSPVTTQHALKILDMISFYDMDHNIYKGIWKYLNSEKDLLDYGWRFTIKSTDDYPHAPWWSYSEDTNKLEYVGLTAELSAFILRFGDKKSSLYKKAVKFTDELLNKLTLTEGHGDMGLSGLITLVKTIEELKIGKYDFNMLRSFLRSKVKEAIEHDTSKWEIYGVRPSNYINSPDSCFYEDNKEIMDIEVQYLLDTKPKDDVWGITWTWFDNMDKYAKEFSISENWWKGFRVIEKMIILKNFKAI